MIWSVIDPRITDDISPTSIEECNECFSNNKVRLGKSCLGDRGAFATCDISAGEVVEVCPLVIEKRSNVPYRSAMDDYVFAIDKSNVAISFGYCSFFNHNNNNNVTWRLNPDTKRMTMFAVRDIKKDEEMFVSYGENYWKSRGIQPISC
jgi:hypothetical protein